jgi:hypothetical protein
MMNDATRSFGLRDSGAVAPSAPDESGLSHAAAGDYHGRPEAGLSVSKLQGQVKPRGGVLRLASVRVPVAPGGALIRAKNIWK